MMGYLAIFFIALAGLANAKAIGDAFFNALYNTNGNANVPEDQLKAPVYGPGERSPEEMAELYQGDIMMVDGRNGIIDTTKRWPNKTIPYVIDARYRINEREIILSAMREIMMKTCIKFVAYKKQKDYIYIISRKNSGCSSYIGRIGRGRQDVTLLSLSDNPLANCMNGGPGTAVHELTHAIGFYHMQSSYDRDDYVTINKGNIEDGKENNFEIADNETVSYFGTLYDYTSIMHYGRTAFSKNGKDTITTKDPAYQDVIGQRTQMSNGDATRIKNMYKC